MDGGIVVPVLHYTHFNHSFLGSGATEEVIVADRVSVAPFTRIGLSVRIHRRNIGTNTSYQFIVRAINPSDEDGADFVFATDLGSTPAGTSTSAQNGSKKIPTDKGGISFMRTCILRICCGMRILRAMSGIDIATESIISAMVKKMQSTLRHI